MHSVNGQVILHFETFIVKFSVLTMMTVNSNLLGRDAISLVQISRRFGKGWLKIFPEPIKKGEELCNLVLNKQSKSSNVGIYILNMYVTKSDRSSNLSGHLNGEIGRAHV